MRRFIAILIVAMLGMVGCGSDSEDLTPAVADDAAATPAQETATTAPVVPATAPDAPAATPETPAATAEAPAPAAAPQTESFLDAALTVPEALESAVTGTMAVEGFVVASASGLMLCELLTESEPPECDGASITLDTPTIAELRVLDPVAYFEADGVTWSEAPVTVFGAFSDGIFIVA